MTRWLPRIAVASLLALLTFSTAFAEQTKLDAHARSAIYLLQSNAIARGGDITSASDILSATESGELDCFIIGSASRAELEAAGARIRFEYPNGVFTAFIPIENVDAVAALASVTKIEGAQICETELDNSVATTNATLFRGPGPTFTGLNGANVIVGDVDTGADYKHDNFKDAGGLTRFLRIWDETDAVGPAGAAPYGSEWLPADMNAVTAREKDTNGHGSHTMGIAGGDGSSAPGGVAAPAFTYTGMAPMGDLIMVRGSTSGSFSTTSLLDGINYIFGRGTFFGKPSVVNMSIGGSSGPHDGSSTFEMSVDAICGAGKTVVFSSGNDGGTAIHAFTNATVGGAVTTMSVTGGNVTNRRFVIDGYYNSTEAMDVTITTPNGTVIGPVTLGANNAAYPGTVTANGAVYVENGMFLSGNNSREVYIDVINQNSGTQNMNGIWTYKFTAITLGAANGRVDQWRYFVSNTALGANFATGNDPQHMLNNGLAGGLNTFSVAAWVSRQNWTDCRAAAWNAATNTTFGQPAIGNLATFSSTGPTRDGRWKPEVAAPGTAIISCRSGDIAVPACGVSPTLNLHGFTHVVNQGTSMAAPHVTGGIALLYQKYGALTPAQLRTIIQARAVVDGFVTALGAVPNPSFGYGKFNLGDMSDPLCTVTSPNGGEVIVIGTNNALTWNASDAYLGVTSVDIELSRTGAGGPYSPIATGIANTGSFNWVATGPTTANAYLRVKASDAAGNSGIDISDQNWAIVDPPVATTLAMFRAEPISDGVRLVWQFQDPSQFSRVSVERAISAQGPWSELDTPITTDGTNSVAIDRAVSAGQTYFYRLAGTYLSGGNATFGTLSATAGEAITEFALKSVGPNPTDGPTVIEYTVPKVADVNVSLFDLQGRVVKVLASGSHPVGKFQVTWNGDSDSGRAAAGVYFLRMKGPNFAQTRRVVVSH